MKQELGKKARIYLIATGGTIASVQTVAGLTPQIPAEELLSYVPEVQDFAEVTCRQLINLDSTNIQAKHWVRMAQEVEDHYDEYDGFVICHGTDTMAYTAAALSYLIQHSPKPIVLTGSQKPINLDSTDARSNLRGAIRFAAHPRAHDVCLVFDGKVICGTRAQKERTKSYDAFASINFPYIATIQEPHVLFYLDDKGRSSGESEQVNGTSEPVNAGLSQAALREGAGVYFAHQLEEAVGLFKLLPSMRAESLVDLASHYRAIIIESFGVGGLPVYDSGDFRQAVAQLIDQGKTVVMTTQVPLEGSNMTVYEVGKQAKETWGLMEAYDMSLPATATKLMWILGQTEDKKEIHRLFQTQINHDRLWPAMD